MNLTLDALPAATKLGSGPVYDDLFICALGFEDRCTAATKLLDQLTYACGNALMLKYDVCVEANEANHDELKRNLRRITKGEVYERLYVPSDLNEVPTDENSARETLEGLLDSYGTDNVSIDISSFSTPALIEMVDLLFTSRIKRLRLVYTEGADYPPSSDMARDIESLTEKYMSTSLRKVITPPTFKGIFTPGYSPLYIAFLGNEPIRARSMLEIYQPSRKIIILVKPSKPDQEWKLELLEKLYRFSITPQDKMTILPNDYKEVYKYLETIYSEYCEVHNINVLPLGSKMQTLAVLLLLGNHRDVKLLIPIPERYQPERYAKGVGETIEMVFT